MLISFDSILFTGLHNFVSPNWISRTYSSHVSWITGQAMELGSVAIGLLNDTWEGHLTPPEVANLADRASRGRDPSMVKAAGELALSCLPHAHNLNPNEISRALIQVGSTCDLHWPNICVSGSRVSLGRNDNCITFCYGYYGYYLLMSRRTD